MRVYDGRISLSFVYIEMYLFQDNNQVYMCKCVFYQKMCLFISQAYWIVGWLVLWHINLYRLFNPKSIFIQIISSISNYSV